MTVSSSLLLSAVSFRTAEIVFLSTIAFAFVAIVVGAFVKKGRPIFLGVALASGLTGIGFLVYAMVELYKNGVGLGAKNEALLYIFTILIVGVIVALALVFGKKNEAKDTRALVYGAVCMALSFGLSYIKLFELPQGGAVTFASLIPLMLYSYMFGIRRGVVIGALYGLLQFVQAPWFYHPVQFLLDYPIAFSAIGLTGLFNEIGLFPKIKPLGFALGALIAVTLRYFSHVISGIFVFGSGDPENYGAVAWSFLYNSFVYVDFAFDLVIGVVITASKSLMNLIEKNSSQR